MLTVDREALAGALAVVGRAVDRANKIPILSHILLEADGDKASLTATNLDITLRASIAATVDGKASMALPAELLRQIAAKAPDDTVSLQDDGARVTIRSGRSRWHVNVLPAADFPAAEHDETYAGAFTLAGAELAELLARTEFAVATPKDERLYLQGVFLQVIDDMLYAVATDGHVLSRLRLDAPDGADQALGGGIIIPDRAVAILKTLTGDLASITIEASKRRIRIAAGGIAFTSKLLDGTYPDWRRVIPGDQPKTARVAREALAAAVERVALIAAERGRGVRLSFGEQGLGVAVADSDRGEADDTVEIGYEGDPLDIILGSGLLGYALAAMADDAITMRLTNASMAVVMTPSSGDNHLIVVMPRVK